MNVLVFFLVVLSVTAASLPFCGSENDDEPSAVVEAFYRRLEKFDTAGLPPLVCASDRDEVESGLGLLQAFIGVGNLSGVPVGELELADFEAETVSNDGQRAVVVVRGRLLAGPPLGSVELDDEIELRKEESVWCMAASSSAAEAGDGGQSIHPSESTNPDLPNMFTANGGCASVEHPDGWSVVYKTDCSELLEKRDFYLPPSTPATCDERSAHFDSGFQVFDLRLESISDEHGVTAFGTDNDAGRVILTFHSYKCSDVDEQLFNTPLCSPYRFCQQEYELADQGPAFDDAIAGYDARCLSREFSRDDFSRAEGVNGEWIQCFLTAGTAWVSVNAIAWESIGPTARQILDTIAVREID